MAKNSVFWYTFERWDVNFKSEAKNKKATLFSSLFLFSCRLPRKQINGFSVERNNCFVAVNSNQLIFLIYLFDEMRS